MQQLAPGAQPSAYVSTHPSHATRIAQITAWMPEALALYHPDAGAEAEPKLLPQRR